MLEPDKGMSRVLECREVFFFLRESEIIHIFAFSKSRRPE